jgi:hypothetical protein
MLPILWRLAPSRLAIHWSLAPRPHYAYCLFQAATLAKRLGIERIGAIEFGVAGGNGLVLLETHARWIERELSVKIEIFGFDAGEGLPEAEDYRDLPYHWKAGFFRLDRGALERRLKSSKLVLGNVRETVPTFFETYPDAPPIGCIFHDLDFYSSTRDALRLLDSPSERFLPRVFNYFDDIVGAETELYNDFTGQRRAIAEFNEIHSHKKIARCYHFSRLRTRRLWHEQIFVLHDFVHPLYNKFISEENQQLPLRP